MGYRVVLISVIAVILGGSASCQGAVDRPSLETEVERIPQQAPPTAHDSTIQGNQVTDSISTREVGGKYGDRSKEKIDDKTAVTALDPAGAQSDAVGSDDNTITSHKSGLALVDQSDQQVKNSYPANFSKKGLEANFEVLKPDLFSQMIVWLFGNSGSEIPTDESNVENEATRPGSEADRGSEGMSLLAEPTSMTEPRALLNVKSNQSQDSRLSARKNEPSVKEREKVLPGKRDDNHLDNLVSSDLTNANIEDIREEQEMSLVGEGELVSFSRAANVDSDLQHGDASTHIPIQGDDGFVRDGGALQSALESYTLSVSKADPKPDSVSSGESKTPQESSATSGEMLEWMRYNVLSDMPAPSIDESDMTDDPKEPAGASLAFVFDSTGSMQDELNQVKVGAAQILAALLASDEILIHNFVLVPFNDPGIGPVSVTTDPKEFQILIEDISVHGGGDCPEMSVGAIKKALQVARPNSYFYIFTDASAKDFSLQDDVLALIQQLQAQIVFILTGTCDDRDTDNYGVYERLADASSGQVYHLSKSEVKQVLKYVKVSLRTNKVNLLSLNRPAPAHHTPDNHTVVIDETLREFTVSVSGRNAGISVRDPQGISMAGSPDVEPLLTLQNVKILSVREPDPGPWHLSVDSESDYSLRATGRSAVHFLHGFSTVPTSNMAETNHRPLNGASCYLLIQASDSVTVHNLTFVDIVGMNGTVLLRLPLSPLPSAPGTFTAANFTPPAEFFHLGISGYGKDGFPIKRVTSTAISASHPEKPRIAMRTRTVGRVNSPLTVYCHVTSLVPFSVLWFRDGRIITPLATHPQTFRVELHIDKPNESSEGNYTCQAKNLAGTEWKTTQVSVTGPPPVVNLPSRVIAAVGDSVELRCDVASDFRATVRWAQLSTRNKFSGILHPVLNGVVHRNHSLTLRSVNEADEGWYVCSAESRAGRGEARVFLEVRDPLRVTVTPSNVSFTRGGSIKLICSAAGRPTPSLQWRRDHIVITNKDPSTYVEEVSGQLHLLLNFLDRHHSGVFSCVATNSEESVTAHAELFYTEKPSVSAAANNVMVRVGGEAVLTCSATGVPQPVVTWRRGGRIIHSDSHFQVRDNTLHIPVVEASDAGELTCVARNVAGEDMDHIGLFVGSPPVFLQRPRDKKIQLGHNGTVLCTVTGSPPPDIAWSRVGGDGLLDTRRMLALPGGALRITHAQVSDAGRYLCTADNPFGNVSAQVSVAVTGIVKPLLDKNLDLSEVRVVAGGTLSLPCGVALGNPPGVVTWLRDGSVVNGSVLSDGRLELENVTASVAGAYTCVVANALGNASRVFQLDILESPHLAEVGPEPDKPVTVNSGRTVVLPCPVTGNPRPKIRWLKEGSPINITKNLYQNVNGSLVIEDAGEGGSGLYTCTGTSELGSVSSSILLEVHVPPKPLEGGLKEQALQEVVEGHVVVFNCQMHAVPTPRVSWYKDSVPLDSDAEQVTSQVLRFEATVDRRGLYKCVVTNEAGTATRQFQLNILVPPRIADPGDEPVYARAGGSATLRCGVTGVPAPDVLWRRHGSYLTRNTSDLTLMGTTLLLSNVSEDAGGAYTCDAENMAGIAQQTFYLQVTFPPRIVEEEGENGTISVTVREGEEFSVPCLAEGSPRPEVSWMKDGEPIHPYLAGIVILGDNTLVFVQVREEHRGVYVCRATNSEGFSEKEFRLEVATPPTLFADMPTRMEVGEGDTLTLTCPTSATPPPVVHWIKDGRPLAGMLVERGDEAPMRLSPDRRQLVLAEAHPADTGNYSCVAVNAAGRTDAKFAVSVLMTPHFEEFNHVGRRSVLVGGSVSLNCSVSGNPPPQVSWRKDGVPVVPGRPPGVLTSRDYHHLMVPNARTHHSGTYTCIAANKITSKEREFYITVLEPPSIQGSGQEDVELMVGQRLTLDCPAGGEPRPQITWYSEDCDGTRRALNETDDHLIIENVTGNHSTSYFCEAVSTAGTASKLFNVTVLVPPVIEGGEELDDIEVTEGRNVSLRCLVRGHPQPEVAWLHNGVELEPEGRRRSRRAAGQSEEMLATLTLNAVDRQAQGLYTVVASNRAGFSEKNFRVIVSVPPRVVSEVPHDVVVVSGRTAELPCSVEASPAATVTWFDFVASRSVPAFGDDRHSLSEGGSKLIISNVSVADAGNYSCVAANPAGKATLVVTLHVLVPPWFPDGSEDVIESALGWDVSFNCTAKGSPQPTISWVKGSQLLSTSTTPYLTLTDLDIEDSGRYTCVASNVAGAAEKVFILHVLEPPVLRDASFSSENYQNVSLHRRFELNCPISGHPRPDILWYKDDEELALEAVGAEMLGGGGQLVVLTASPHHTGNYKCVARNPVGIEHINFYVSVSVTASWTAWSGWSECSVSCGPGLESRHRTCSFGPGALDPRLVVDKSQCKGDDREQRDCFTPCPVDGGWSSWSPWGDCSVSCGNGSRRRQRECSHPSPSLGGKSCEGASVEEEQCSPLPCPATWSEWSEWSECSRACGGGERSRWRTCENQDEDERKCEGSQSETELCNTQPCSGGGKWLPWGEWSSCSATCGTGVRRRVRQCKQQTQLRLKPCKDKVQLEVCQAQPCSARLQVRGEMNGKAIDAELAADLTGSRVEARADLAAEAAWFPYAPLLLTPVAWSAAIEEDSAANGFSLTGGRFLTQSQVSFVTGEDLQVRTEGRGVDSKGRMIVEIEVAGEAPILQSAASVHIKSLQQDFVQVGSDELLGLTEDVLLMDGREVPFQINSSVKYDGVLGTMPYLVEKLSLTDIESHKAPLDQHLAFAAAASVSRRFDHDVCPPGFLHDQKHLHCADLDECLEEPCPSGQTCSNTWGSYSCACPEGYEPGMQGGCVDVNECDARPPRCHHSCINIGGSYHCLCSMGYVLAADGTTCNGGEGSEESEDLRTRESDENLTGTSWVARRAAPWLPSSSAPLSRPRQDQLCPAGYTTNSRNAVCQDVDECTETPGVCGQDGLCLNTPGSFQCLDIPCPPGFTRQVPSTSCTAECDVTQCKRGARVAETVVFALLPLQTSKFLPYEDLLQLTVHDNGGVRSQQARVVEGRALRLRTVDNHASLYAPAPLNRRTLYRVVAEVASLGTSDELLYSTEFVVFVVLND